MGIKTAQQEPERAWDGICRRSLSVTTRALDPETRSFEVVASTDTVDSHGDIIEQTWDLNRYRKNPVVFWNHNNFESSRWSFGGACDPEDFLPIGKAENVRVESGALVAKIVLLKATDEEEPLVAKIWRRVEQGVLRAVSVGFYPGTITEELAPGGTLFRIGECELLEISLVPIPSNPDTVAKAKAFERQHLARMAGSTTATAERTDNMMSPEEKAAYEAAQAEAKTAKDRAEKAERDLATEKTASAKLEKDLSEASAREKASTNKLIEQEISALVGKKITPAEKDEEIVLAKEIGLERVKSRLAKRPDMTLTDRVKAAGEEVAGTKPSPAPVDGKTDASADIAKTATAAANAAA